MTNINNLKPIVIIGSGPAGLTAALYSARADYNPIVYEGLVSGGQLTTATVIENYPGFPEGIQGTELMQKIREQASKFGAELLFSTIDKVDFSKHPFTLWDDKNNEIKALSVIIATGASPRMLGIPSEKEYFGQGVSTCATCDGYFYKGKVVAVIGGGDTAAMEAIYLSNLASKVYIIHRRDELRACACSQKKILNTPNIEVIWDSVVDEIIGETKGFAKYVTAIKLKNVKTNTYNTINVDGVFIAIGHHPNTELFVNQLELTEEKYIKTIPGTTKTNVDGVFACGDVQDPVYKQAVIAAGSGAMAALDTQNFLEKLY